NGGVARPARPRRRTCATTTGSRTRPAPATGSSAPASTAPAWNPNGGCMAWDKNVPPLHGEGQPMRSIGRVGKSAATTKRARGRSNTPPTEEARLWMHLRRLRADGFHFRRQAPLLGFYLDFVCFKHRLVIEVDGSQHGEEVQADHDAKRHAILNRAGFRQ